MKTLRWTLCVLALGGYGCVSEAPSNSSPPTEFVALDPIPVDLSGPPSAPVDSPTPTREVRPERERPDTLWQSAGQVAAELQEQRMTDATQRSWDLVNELNALELFEADGVLVEFPAGTECIYACRLQPGAVQDHERKNALLSALVNEAKHVDENVALFPHLEEEVSRDEANAHLQTLRDLGVVGVRELIEEEPAARAECYNLPCPGDIEAAEEENARRRRVVKGLAQATEHMAGRVTAARCDEAQRDTAALLDDLRGLSLFEANDLIAERNESAPCFYVDQRDEPWLQEWEAQIDRLEGLVWVAETVRSQETMERAGDVDEALDAIDGLEIVEVGEMLESLPQSAASCYVCPEVSEDQADTLNERRAADIITIAELSEEL